AGAAVMHKHGWTMGELMSSWGPYIALVGAVVPPSLVTYQAIKQRQADEQAAARQLAQRQREAHPVNPAAGQREGVAP
ncbi:hypothetical protein, partial [Roseateles violae]